MSSSNILVPKGPVLPTRELLAALPRTLGIQTCTEGMPTNLARRGGDDDVVSSTETRRSRAGRARCGTLSDWRSQDDSAPVVHAGHVSLGLADEPAGVPLSCPVCRRAFERLGDRCQDHDRLAVPDSELTRKGAGPALGLLLGGKYALLAQLGRGGMGTVYWAIKAPTGRPVAVKVLRPELTSDFEAEQRFMREARALAEVIHPHLVSCYDYGLGDNRMAYMALEFIQGESLKDALLTGLDAASILTMAQQILEAMTEMHAAGVVHRDLKPSNIMLAARPGAEVFVKIIDFGLARLIGPDVIRLTMRGDVFGTPTYMSPEQASGNAESGRPADVYSLGIVLWEALTGSPPFTGEQPVFVMQQHMARPLPDFVVRPDIADDVPPGIEPFLRACLQKDPAQRPQNGDAALEAFVAARWG
jgi:eukaryotic-like serine/threonine-protein kinase